MTFHEKVTRLCEDRNKSKLSRRAGLSSTGISSYIAKGCLPRLDIALRIARAIGVSLDWLADDTANWPPVWLDESRGTHGGVKVA